MDGSGEYLSTHQIADEFGVKEATVRQWRWRGVGPPGTRIAGGLVRYRRSEVEAWVAEQRARDAERRVPGAQRGGEAG